MFFTCWRLPIQIRSFCKDKTMLWPSSKRTLFNQVGFYAFHLLYTDHVNLSTDLHFKLWLLTIQCLTSRQQPISRLTCQTLDFIYKNKHVSHFKEYYASLVNSWIPLLSTPGPNFIELLQQKILLNHFLLIAEMSRIPVTNCIRDMAVLLVTLFW